MNESIESRLQFVEKMFLKYGAKRVPEEKEERLQLRATFCLNDIYYRVESDEFEEGTAIVITATDNAKFAGLGLEDNIAGFRADLDEARMEQEVRYALGIDPYPEGQDDVL